MKTELLRVRTADGITLDGCLMSPEVIDSKGATDSVEVWLLVHGTGGNFYSPGVLETFAAQMAGVGLASGADAQWHLGYGPKQVPGSVYKPEAPASAFLAGRHRTHSLALRACRRKLF